MSPSLPPGELIAFDVRQRRVRLSVRAHEKNIKTIALSPGDAFVATGGLDGDVKVPVSRLTAMPHTTSTGARL